MNRRRQAAVGAWLLVVVAGTGAGAQELSFEERVAARERLERVYLRYRTGTTSGQTPSRERLETMVRQQIARLTYVDTQRPGLISPGDLHRERERIERDRPQSSALYLLDKKGRTTAPDAMDCSHRQHRDVPKLRLLFEVPPMSAPG